MRRETFPRLSGLYLVPAQGAKLTRHHWNMVLAAAPRSPQLCTGRLRDWSQRQLRTGPGFHHRAKNYLKRSFSSVCFFFSQKNLHTINSSIQLKPQVFTLVPHFAGQKWPPLVPKPHHCYHGTVCTAELQPWHLPAAQVPLLLDSYKHIIIYMICILSNNI